MKSFLSVIQFFQKNLPISYLGDEVWPLGFWAQDGESGLALTISTDVHLISTLPTSLYPYSLLCLVPKAQSSSNSFLQRVHIPALSG